MRLGLVSRNSTLNNLSTPSSITPIDRVTIARLYNTNIAIADYNSKTITLNSGGWKTKHTKKCLNHFLDRFEYNVYQEKFVWYVARNGVVTEFTDGMVLPI